MMAKAAFTAGIRSHDAEVSVRAEGDGDARIEVIATRRDGVRYRWRASYPNIAGWDSAEDLAGEVLFELDEDLTSMSGQSRFEPISAE